MNRVLQFLFGPERNAIVYTLAVLDKDGNVIASKNVRTDVDGVPIALGRGMDRLKELEFTWALRGKELLRDALYREGRWL